MDWANECTSIEETGGRHRAVIGIKPRAYLRDGTYRAMTFRLGDTGDPVLPHGLDELLAIRFANNLAGQSPTVHVGRGKNHIRMTALATRNVSGSVVYDATGLPIGRRYNGAWTEADLEYLAGGHYLRKNVYLKTGHPGVFEFRIDGLAGTLSPSSRGWDLLDDAGRPVLWAGAGYLYRPDQPEALTVPVATTVRVQGGKSIYRYELPAGDWSGWVLEPTWTVQPDATSGEDTYLHSVNATFNQGALGFVVIGTAAGVIYRSLLRFPTTGLAGTIQSATLTAYNLDGAATTANNTANVHSVLTANGDWVEGTKSGAQAGAGEPCWNAKAANGSGGVTTAWAGSVGCGTSGTDYAATVIGTLAIVDGVAAAISTSLPAATITAWLDGENYGLLLRGADEATSGKVGTLASSDGATASQRPSLSVEYSLTAAAAGSSIGRGRNFLAKGGRARWP